MIGGELQRGEDHAFLEGAGARVVTPEPPLGEVFSEEHKVFGVPVPLLRKLSALGRLVELGLQVRPRVERGVARRIHLTPTGLEVEAPVQGLEFQDVGRRLGHPLVGVRVHAEEQCLGGELLHHRRQHGHRQQAVRVAVEARQGHVHACDERPDGQEVALLPAPGLHVELLHRGEEGGAEQHHGVLVPLRAVSLGEDEQVVLRVRGLQQLDELVPRFLQEDDVGIHVRGLQDLAQPIVLAAVQRVADLPPEDLPGLAAPGLHQVHERGVEDTLQHQLQRYADGLLLLRDGGVLRPLDLLQEAVDGPRALAVEIDLPVEEEGHPLLEPLVQGGEAPGVAVPHRWPEERCPGGQLDRVGHTIRHAGEPLLADLAVPKEL
mmetsp:Transcript_5491/g.14588  ORF Transcript_5491/g.14588 Transcript_5491/m.14588 type:complete len:377 (-) Transcript_5491:457-1587(-)